MTNLAFSRLERGSIAICCALSLMMFFLPLLSLRVPMGGEQEVSGYDVFSKLNGVRENLESSKMSPDETSPSTNQETDQKFPEVANIPLSIETSWLIPVEIGTAFLCAVGALIGAFQGINMARWFSVVSVCSAAMAILHITVLNSDLHSWLANSMKAQRADLQDNPFAGLAEGLGSLMANAFQLKPGWALYAVALLSGLAAVLAFSRILSRLSLLPSPSES